MILKVRNHRRLTRIIKRDRRAAIPQISADSRTGASTSVSVLTVQRTMTFRANDIQRTMAFRLIWTFRAEGPLVYRY